MHHVSSFFPSFCGSSLGISRLWPGSCRYCPPNLSTWAQRQRPLYLPLSLSSRHFHASDWGLPADAANEMQSEVPTLCTRETPSLNSWSRCYESFGFTATKPCSERQLKVSQYMTAGSWPDRYPVETPIQVIAKRKARVKIWWAPNGSCCCWQLCCYYCCCRGTVQASLDGASLVMQCLNS